MTNKTIPQIPIWYCDEHKPAGAIAKDNKHRLWCQQCKKPGTHYQMDDCRACLKYINEYGVNCHYPRHDPLYSSHELHCSCDSCF